MKKVLGVLLAGLFLIAGNASAHCGKCGVGDSDHGHGDVVAQKIEKMGKELSLTDEQKPKVEAILNEKMGKKQALMEEGRKSMDSLHEEYKGKLKEVLSEEQFKKWEDMKGDAKGHCPMCKDGKMCDKCKMMKGKGGHCPECKDGKMCAKCEKMSKKDCPKCKDGKICKKCQKCKMKKEDKDDAGHEGHDHGKEGNKGYIGR